MKRTFRGLLAFAVGWMVGDFAKVNPIEGIVLFTTVFTLLVTE